MASTRFSSAIRSPARSAWSHAGLGEVQAGGAAGQQLAGGRRVAVPDQQQRGQRWGEAASRGAPCRPQPTVVVRGSECGLAASGGATSSAAAPAHGWWRGASRWRARSAPRSVTRPTGAAGAGLRRPRRRASSCSGWRRRRTAPTAPAGCSPATAAATGCSAPCTAPGWPTSRRRSPPTTGWQLTGAWVTAAVKCAPPGNQPSTDERDACAPYLSPRARAAARPARRRLPRRVRVRGGVPAPRGGAPRRDSGTASRSALDSGLTLRVLVPPQPAEHVHRAAHRGDARRRVRPRRGVARSGDGPATCRDTGCPVSLGVL